MFKGPSHVKLLLSHFIKKCSDLYKTCTLIDGVPKEALRSRTTKFYKHIELNVLEMYKKMEGFERTDNYTDIYKKCGMLGSKTIMGHGIHLSKGELETLAKTKTVIATP